MTITKLSDVLIPGSLAGVEVNNLIKKKTLAKNAFFRSGIIGTQLDPTANVALNVPDGGKFVSVKFRNALTGAEQIADDTADGVINKVTYGSLNVPIFDRFNAFGVTDLAVDLGGDDPMDDIAEGLADYWTERFQIQMINILNGAMSAASISNNVYDISGNTGAAAVISPTSFILASQKLGDLSSKITAVAMHSAVYAQLLIQNLIQFVPSAEQGKLIATYLDKEVIVDDGMPFNAGTGVATIYLFTKGAVAYQEGTPKTPVEVDRNSLINSGQEWIVSRKKYIMSPVGFNWNTGLSTAAPTPTNSELATGGNWTAIYNPKEIGIVKFVAKIA